MASLDPISALSEDCAIAENKTKLFVESLKSRKSIQVI